MKKFRVEIRITTYDDFIVDVDAVDVDEAYKIAAEEYGDADSVKIEVFEIES